MEPQVTQFMGKVYVMVPDHIEDVVVIRKSQAHQFTIPQYNNRLIHRVERDEPLN